MRQRTDWSILHRAPCAELLLLMLKRIYADNFKCLVNFDWQPGPATINLLLGPNGGGKSTVLECLDSIRAFATGENTVDDLFPGSTLTLWQDVLEQKLEIDIERTGSVYRYELVIEHDKSRAKRRVSLESLSYDGKPLLRFAGGEVRLYRDNHSEGPVYPFDWSRSVMASLAPRPENTKLTWFKTALRGITVLQIVPPMMEETSIMQTPRPLRYFQNFVSWYRWVSEDQGTAFRLQRDLKNILPRFSHFRFEEYGPEARLLKAVFDQDGANAVALNFCSLSDGQRMLVALYALLNRLSAESLDAGINSDLPGGMLCLDEPDNFIASREIQPWLSAVEDRLLNTKARLLMISHHPESIDYALIPSSGEAFSAFWFSREEGRHTRVQPVAAEAPDGLKPSELAARGWLTG